MSNSNIAALVASMPWTVLKDENGNPSGEIVTPPLRVTYLAIDKLYTSKKYPTRSPEASITLALPSGMDFAALKAEAQRVAMEHFGDRLKQEISVPNLATGEIVKVPAVRRLQMPWKSDDAMKGKPGFSTDGAGFFIRCKSREAPVRVIGPDKKLIPVTLGGLGAEQLNPALYPGMYVRALLRVYAYPGKKNMPAAIGPETIMGVSLDVKQLQKIVDGERIEVRGGAGDDAFGVVAGAVMSSGSAPVAGADTIDWGT